MITVADGRKLYAAPDDDTQTAFLAYVQTATKQVLLADYSFNLVPLVQVLKLLQSNGVQVQLVLDRSQTAGKSEQTALEDLKTAGFTPTIGTSDKHQIMHDKFVVVDDSVLYGSWNFTTNASDEDNFFVVDPSATVATWFSGVWQKIHDWIIQNEPQTGVI